MPKPSVRVRFAPSPTGFLHLGGIRSALFDYLFAKHTEGTFVLRLEDTDRERLVPAAAESIMESLRWLGLKWDEGAEAGGEYGPYVQSDRLDIYLTHAKDLVEKGWLYPCWCSSTRLDELRRAAQSKHEPFKYDRHCLDHPGDIKDPHVLRFKIPAGQTIAWNDTVKGELSFRSDDLDDFVCIKSDGFPTYNFAVVVDDHEMRITHVLRGDEFIPTTPKNILIYRAFGWDEPVWVHLPQVLGPDKAKLSKRHGAKPALDYRDEGYLPEAVVNFMAFLGWNPGDGSTREVFSLDELVKAFSLERIQPSSAVFDSERLLWLNGLYIRQLPVKELLERLRPFWTAAKGDEAYLARVLRLVQDRLKTLAEINELTDFFFEDPKVSKELLDKIKPDLLPVALEAMQDSDFSEESLEHSLRRLAERRAIKTADLFGSLRIVLTGRTASPGLFETMRVLGKTAVERRLRHAIDAMSK